MDAMAKLRLIYPNLMKLGYDNKRTRSSNASLEVTAVEKKTPLDGAKFTINGTELVSGSKGEKGYTDIIELPVKDTAYELKETKAPDGYNLPENDIQIKVSPDGVKYQQSDDHGGEPKTAAYDSAKGAYVVIVTNNSGVELPNSGGPGTTLYTLGGLMLVIASALMYGFRMRRRERRFR